MIAGYVATEDAEGAVFNVTPPDAATAQKFAELNVIGVMARAMLHPALHMALVSGTTRMGANHQMRSEAGLLVRVGQGGFRSADGLRRERHHPRHFLGTLALQKRPEAFVHAPVHIDGISADRDAADRSI